MTSSIVSERSEQANPEVCASLLKHTFFAGLILIAFVFVAFIPPGLRAVDFAAFYCAGEAITQHADPYRTMPLGACEHRVATGPLYRSGVVMPAPLPPYALPVMAGAARLPYSTAQHVLDIISIGALLISAVYLGNATRSGTMVALFALAPLGWYIVVLGQPLLIMLGVLVACGVLLGRGHDAWAAVCASAMMLEPHLGLPVCLSIFLWRPRTRMALIIIMLAIALMSVTVLPWRLTLEYVNSVVPLHARSEAASSLQYSTTVLLSTLGVPVSIALAVGSVQYVLTVGFGILVARWTFARLGDASALAFVPCLFAVIGGTYIHDTDFLLAIPAALLLLAHSRYSAIVAVATIALGPHRDVIIGLPGLLLGVMCAGAMLTYLRRGTLAFVCLIALGAMAELSATIDTRAAGIKVIPAAQPTAFADQSWAEYMREIQVPKASLLDRAPEWLGLIVLCSVAAARRRTPTSAVAYEPVA